MSAEPARSSSSSTGTTSTTDAPSRDAADVPLAPVTGPHSPVAAATTREQAVPAPVPARHHADQHPTGRRLGVLTLTALGVVFGDIGTSPLYAFKECFHSEFGVAATRDNVLGLLSLLVWAMMLIVSVKYVVFIMMADNRGEGGILALLALIQQRFHGANRGTNYAVLVSLGLFGAALLYGDGVITPVISIMGALEGINVATDALAHWVVPLTLGILVGLFSFQRLGTARVGVVFGPIMALWFVSITVLGLRELVHQPGVLAAINPWYAARFMASNGRAGFLVLGAVVLVLTGAEALYADMGHFGRRPIRLAWFALVVPALLISYFGQGALLLRNPAAAENPFFHLVPAPLLIPVVVLGTAAACIASQALISGAFSLTRQAVQLGYSPRVTITHTSRHEAGQIYIKEVNTALLVGCIYLTIQFGSATAIAAAYGIAVTGTMVITTILFAYIAHQQRGWALWQSVAFCGFFLIIDGAFLAANAIKIEHGGWFPLVVGGVVYLMMTTWKRGRDILRDIMHRASLPLDLFLNDIERNRPPRVPGTAVFMTSDPEGAPVVLLHHLKHNKMLHEQVILLSIVTLEVPDVPPDERVSAESLGHGFFRMSARFGFMETPNVPQIMSCCEAKGIRAHPRDTSYYLGRERLIPIRRDRRAGGRGTAHTPASTGVQQPKSMFVWRKKLFVFMSRNARTATEYFGLPPNRVVELGAQLEF